MAVQENTTNLAQYKGTVRVCEFCKPEEVLLGRACQWCMSQGYLSECLSCHGSGKVTSGSVWDGGRSQYTATCNPCGGKGTFPAREADYLRQQRSRPSSDPVNGNYRSMPRTIAPMQHLDLSNRRK